MEKKIEQLLGGRFEYELPQLIFSKDNYIITRKPGGLYQDKLYFGTEDNRKIRGYVLSSHRRLIPGFSEFAGTTVCLPFGVDMTGLQPGEGFEAFLCFVTSIGEYKWKVTVQIRDEQPAGMPRGIGGLHEFALLARQDFTEAFRMFQNERFVDLLEGRSAGERALYEGLSRQPVTYQHLEEFLIGIGEKEKVELALDSEAARFYAVKQEIQECFRIRRSGWGHLRMEIETRGDFLEADKKVVTDEDFIGSFYEGSYRILPKKLGHGTSYGQVVVTTPYQKLVYSIVASRGPQLQVNQSLEEKRFRVELFRDYLEYRLGREDQETFVGRSLGRLEEMKNAGMVYPEYELLEAALLQMAGRNDQAVQVLKQFQNKVFTREELEQAGAYLYLCVQTGLYTGTAQAQKKIQSFYMQKEDSFLLLWLLLKMDPEYAQSSVKVVFKLEEQFEKGCKNPLLYLMAWEYITEDMTLLRRLSPFWAQVFLFAARQGLLTEELSMRLFYLSGYERKFNRSMYRALSMAYEAFPSDDSLEALCKYIMKGNPGEKEFFPWFEKAVEKGLRLTRIYEYYVESMNTDGSPKLPKPLLMYFAYNSDTLEAGKKAYIYASIIRNRQRDPETYQSYLPQMEEFASLRLRQSYMDENYAVIYQELWGKPQNEEQARFLATHMFTCRLYCGDPRIRQVVVRHSQLKEEEVYPCVQGIAYPRLYTRDAVILFQDEKQRRYGSTVVYSLKKLMNDEALLSGVLSYGIEEKGLLLYYCETAQLSRKNLRLFQMLAQSSDFSESYKRRLRRNILEYYEGNLEKDQLGSQLLGIHVREYIDAGKARLLKTLILAGQQDRALELIREYGSEGLEKKILAKAVEEQLRLQEDEENEELLALCDELFRSGTADAPVLEYLVKYKRGPVEELLAVWRRLKGTRINPVLLEERILRLLIFTTDYRKEGEAVLAAYVKHGGKDRIIGAYLTQIAYGIFVKEYPASTFVKEQLERVYLEKWPVNRVCALALFKGLSKEKMKKSREELLTGLLAQCMEEGMEFAFYKKLPPEILSLYQLDDKTFVECHASPRAKVMLFYKLDTGLGTEPEYKSEPLASVYEGIRTRTFTLFYGESLHYYFQIEEKGKIRKTTERVLTMNRVENQAMSKYQLLNQILSARHLEKDQEAAEKMRRYLRQEQYVKEMFVIEKEP